jgi:hypothetical protein
MSNESPQFLAGELKLCAIEEREDKANGTPDRAGLGEGVPTSEGNNEITKGMYSQSRRYQGDRNVKKICDLVERERNKATVGAVRGPRCGRHQREECKWK